jgi:hypothetical protein
MRKFSLILLFIATTLGLAFVYSLDQERREVKEDLKTIQNIKYGLLNVDEWKAISGEIIRKKIDEFELSSKNKESLRTEIPELLNEMIDVAETEEYERNRQKLFGGLLTNTFMELAGVFNKLRSSIPEMTEKIIDHMEKPRTKEGLKKFFNTKLDEYASATFSEIDYSEVDRITLKYGAEDSEDCKNILKGRLGEKQQFLNFIKYALITLGLFWISLAICYKNIDRFLIVLLYAVSGVFLLFGLVLPMIEIEASIVLFKFQMLGQNIEFADQVLYYRSKSVLELVSILFSNLSFDLILVGFLVVLFSVIFPLMKLIFGIMMLYKPNLESKKFVRTLVFKTAKWSMSDVFVVSMFMAYLGISGMIGSQMGKIENSIVDNELIAMDDSEIGIGFYCYLIFVLLGILISSKIKRMSNLQEN